LSKPDCRLCKKLLSGKDKKPKCGKCLPDLMPENKVLFEIFWLVKNQHIMGPGGPIDLKIDILHSEIERRHIDDKQWCFDLVYAAYLSYLDDIKERLNEARNSIR
jgi:hypothetical protein